VAQTIHDVLRMFPGLAEAVANATPEQAILNGMRPEDRQAMEPVVRSIVRSGKKE